MALPANANVGYVTGTFMDNSGALASGTVTFTASPVKILDPESSPPVTILPLPVTAQLSSGAFIQQLIATDDVDLEPLGFTYNVSFNLTAGGRAIKVPDFNILVPTGLSTAAVDLAVVTPVDPNSGVVIDINQDVLTSAETYTDDVLAAHVIDADPHHQYVRMTDAGTGAVVSVRLIRAFEADPLPPVVAGAYLVKGGF